MATYAQMLAALRDLGHKVTAQRMAVIRFLEDNLAHPSAADVHTGIRGHFPGLSLATVYITLEVLQQAGLLHQVPIAGERSRFDPNTEPHHHLRCRECGRLNDVALPDLDAVVPTESLPPDFLVEGLDVVISGVCGDCREPATPGAPAPAR